MKKGVIQIVSVDQVPPDAKMLNMVKVEKVKRDGTYKSRFCVDGRSQWFDGCKDVGVGPLQQGMPHVSPHIC